MTHNNTYYDCTWLTASYSAILDIVNNVLKLYQHIRNIRKLSTYFVLLPAYVF